MLKNPEKDIIKETQKNIKAKRPQVDLENEVLVDKDDLKVLTSAEFNPNITKNKQVSSKKTKLLLGLFGGIAAASLAAGTAMLVIGINKSKEVPVEDPKVPHSITFTKTQEEGWELYCYDVNGEEVTQAKKGDKIYFLTYLPDSARSNDIMKSPTILMINEFEFALTKIDSYTYYTELEVPFAKNMDCKLKFEETLAYNLVVLDAGEDAYFTSTGSQYILVPVGVGQTVKDSINYEEPIYKDESLAFSGWFEEITQTDWDLSKPVYTNMYLTPKSQSAYAPALANYKSAIGIKALSDLTVYITNKPSSTDYVKYSVDNGETWNYLSSSAISPTAISKGSNIYLISNNPSGFNKGITEKDNGAFKFSGDFSLSGSIMGLLDNGTNTITEIPNKGCFAYLFTGNTGLKCIDKNFLPADTLSEYCYRSTFAGCNNLKNVPNLPATVMQDHCYSETFYACPKIKTIPTDLFANATTLATDCFVRMFANTGIEQIPTKLLSSFKTLESGCYRSMFENCDNLKTLPEGLLPAETMQYQCYCDMFKGCENLISVPTNLLQSTYLEKHCYEHMFAGCTNLQNTPNLPATDLTGCDYCYNYMFQDCENLKACPNLPADKLSAHCYDCMFLGCKTLTTAPELLATTLFDGCYTYMFGSCDSLVSGPSTLPATVLPSSCYLGMFDQCVSLRSIPDMQPLEASSESMSYMFQNCETLTTIPTNLFDTTMTSIGPNACKMMFCRCFNLQNPCNLPATTLAEGCYEGMFAECHKLQVPQNYELPATVAAKNCYADMFSHCEEMISAPIINLTQLAESSCSEMFYCCSQLKINNESTGTAFFTCPSTIPTNAVKDMFKATGGAFSDDPIADTTYYFG